MQSIKNIINNNLFIDKKDKTETNNLLQAVEYTIYNISEPDLIYFYIFQYLLDNIPNKLPVTIKDQFITSFYCHYTAYQNIYNLPSMINKNKCTGCNGLRCRAKYYHGHTTAQKIQ